MPVIAFATICMLTLMSGFATADIQDPALSLGCKWNGVKFGVDATFCLPRGIAIKCDSGIWRLRGSINKNIACRDVSPSAR